MKRRKSFYVLLLTTFFLSACAPVSEDSKEHVVEIKLNENVVESDVENAVYVANDTIYYEEGKDFTYGEGDENSAHSKEEAEAHTVVHITEPGTYRLSGTLSLGQIAVDLGEEAKENPEAVVTLILDDVDITCQVAPAIIFYNVYECGNSDADKAMKDVDTSAAGANVIIADGSTNEIHGSYVEKIYKPDTVVLNEDGTEVEDAKKLHKYDGAFYSRMSMNVTGEDKNDGVLNIYAENEGLDSELHLTINGGNINIQSGNDGINTNEDGVSVTTINGGNLTIQVTGTTGEGDGIDSNGWLVINGGTVVAAACSDSADAGIDSDMGIHINGGTVLASGHMLDRIEEGGQTYAIFNLMQKQDNTGDLFIKDEAGTVVLESNIENAYSVLVYSSPDLKAGTYTLWNSNEEMIGQSGGPMGGFGNGPMPGMQPPERPEGFEGMQPPERPEGCEGMEPPERPEGFEGMEPPERPEGFEGMEPPAPPKDGEGKDDKRPFV